MFEIGKMILFHKTLIYALLALSLCTIIAGCSKAEDSTSGVAKINPEDLNVAITPENMAGNPLMPRTADDEDQTNEELENLSDEEITTIFADCLRKRGFDVPDPELNADGTINVMRLRQSLGANSNWNTRNQETRQAREDCLPILSNVSFAREGSQEDEIALQDNLLKFSECLREEGLDANDPDFSSGVRAAFQSVLQNIDGNSEKIREIVLSCREGIFQGTGGSQAPGGGHRRP